MDRGQAHTLEAFVAAVLLVAGLIFASQATAVTPLSTSTSDQHIENQHREMATDLLSTAHADGSLRETLVHWDTETRGFHGSNRRGYYTDGGPSTDFGEALNETLREDRIAFNVDIRYWACETVENGAEECERDRQRLVWMGPPSDTAATATQTVALFERTEIGAENGEPRMLADAEDAFYAPNAGGGSDTLYNVVEVRITLWTT